MAAGFIAYACVIDNNGNYIYYTHSEEFYRSGQSAYIAAMIVTFLLVYVAFHLSGEQCLKLADLALTRILNFILFIGACVDTARRNASHPVVVVAAGTETTESQQLQKGASHQALHGSYSVSGG